MHRFWTKNHYKKIGKIILSYKKALGALLVATGVFLVFVTPVYKHRQESILPTPETVVEHDHGPIQAEQSLLQETATASAQPVRVIIPKAGIDVPVKPAKVIGGVWEVFDDSGSHGLGSAYPGEIGNMVIFAHARKDYFLNLREVTLDYDVYVFTDDTWFQYQVVDIKEVTPNDISVIKPTEDETLTLYTCSGFADSKRMIVAAKRVK